MVVDGRIRKSDLIALMRIMALMLTEDTAGVDAIIDWAYEKETLNPKQSDIIKEFLSTDKVPTIEQKRAFIKRYIKGCEPFPVEEAESIIKGMKYREFLTTPYWQAIAMFIRKRDGRRCQMCGATRKLHVHHKTYEHHGDELHHLDDLMCLCEDCHKKTHINDK